MRSSLWYRLLPAEGLDGCTIDIISFSVSRFLVAIRISVAGQPGLRMGRGGK